MKQILIISLIVIGVIVVGLLLNKVLFRPIKNPQYGVSFSQKYAQELSLDWRAAYTALLDDLDFKKLRLMSYWDLHEASPGKYDFKNLDWQFDEAKKRETEISLVLGLRQPRWPECHQPEWAKQLSVDERNQKLNDYIKTVVERYKGHPALASWQLENEAMNRQFGECEKPDRKRLIVEYDLVKRLDRQHPIIMSLSDQHGLPVGQPVPDIYGFSVYRTFYNWWGYKGYITYPTPVWYHRLRAFKIHLIHNRPIIIHELQAEPWGPDSIPTLSTEEQNKSMSVDQLKKNLEFAKRTGIEEQYLWGGEWWYWRLQHGDDSIWNTIKEAAR